MFVRLFGLIAVITLIGVPASAQNASGKWNTSIDSPQGEFAMVFEFEVDGTTLNGSMSNEFMGSVPISEGMINGNELSFKLSIEGGPGGAMMINYKGMVDGDTLNLTSTFEGAPPGGGPAEQVLTATRAQ
jgi:hypothetical protein